jgi:glycerophosphoryl diester phosphodiesterase
MKHSILVLIGSILLLNCTRPERSLDLQGHRGARGLFPENSLHGFEKALEIPEVSTLELDLCVTADDQLIISHEIGRVSFLERGELSMVSGTF